MAQEDAETTTIVLGALFLGVLQGLTEFLPVSSSGHLVLFQQFLEIKGDEVLFDLVLHVGTLIPVLYFYREHIGQILRDPIQGEGPMLEREGVRMGGLVVLASIPTAIIGLSFKDQFKALIAKPEYALQFGDGDPILVPILAITFAITGCLLLLTKRFESGTLTVATMPWHYAVLLGIAQGLAITPGISRSGTTIAVALMLGLNREFAARLSFLMSVPAIGGAVLLLLRDADLAALNGLQLGVGFISSMVVGYFALTLLVKLIQQGNFHRFAWYCFGAAAVAGAVAYT